MLIVRRAAHVALCTQCGRVVESLPISAASAEAGIDPALLEYWIEAGMVHRLSETASLLCADSLLRAMKQHLEGER